MVEEKRENKRTCSSRARAGTSLLFSSLASLRLPKSEEAGMNEEDDDDDAMRGDEVRGPR